MRKDYQVRMESEEYGEEVFNYSTLKEARAGFRRLEQEAAKYNDVERHIELVEVLQQVCVEPQEEV